MDKSKLKIASVKLINSGMKGIEVEYLLPSVKANVMFNDVYKSKRKAPIHSELEECFSWLRNHLLDICGYTLEKEEREYLLNSLEMTGVKYGPKGIILMGDLAILGGDKVLSLETPLIVDEMEYPEYGKLVSIIDGIYTETKEYMEGRKVMSDAQIVTRFNAKNQEFDAESFSKMTKQEQRDLATKILEDQGCMVFHNDDLGGEEAEALVIDATEAFKTPPVQEFTFDQVNTPENTKPDPFAEEKAPKEFVINSESVVTLIEEDDFALPIRKKEPAKASTAKKKAA